MSGRGLSSSGQAEPIVVVPVVPIVPVAVGDPAIVVIVVPSAAAQHGGWCHTRRKDRFYLENDNWSFEDRPIF